MERFQVSRIEYYTEYVEGSFCFDYILMRTELHVNHEWDCYVSETKKQQPLMETVNSNNNNNKISKRNKDEEIFLF